MTTWNLNTPPDETERLRARVRHLQERLGETRDALDLAERGLVRCVGGHGAWWDLTRDGRRRMR